MQRSLISVQEYAEEENEGFEIISSQTRSNQFKERRNELIKAAEQIRENSLSASPPPSNNYNYNQRETPITEHRSTENLNFRNVKNADFIRKTPNQKLNSGIVWAFGRNKEGELGLGNLKDATTPQNITGIESARSISSGQHHTVIVTKSGDIYSCGSSLHGKLGLPSTGLINIQRFTQIKQPIKAK